MDESLPTDDATAVPEIEPVRTVTVAPIKPGAGWYWIGAVTLAMGLLVAFLMLVVGSFGYIREITDGTGTVVVSAEEEADAQERLSNWGRGALVVAGAGVVGGTAVIVVTARGRQRSRAARLTEQTS